MILAGWEITNAAMKINLIESFCNQDVGFVRVVAEDGSFGWGQLSTYNADITQQILHRQVAPWALGREVSTPVMLNDTLDLITEKEHKFPGSYLRRAMAGFDTAIKKLNFNVEGKKVLILGAGGVVSSIIIALKNMNVQELIISNRTREKAENLRVLFDNLKILDWGDLTDFHMVINATSLGLNNETIDLDFSSLGQDKLFYDVIYNPHETHFLKMGKQLGHKIENGKTMFIYQALEAFKLWHNIVPKVNRDTFKLLDND